MSTKPKRRKYPKSMTCFYCEGKPNQVEHCKFCKGRGKHPYRKVRDADLSRITKALEGYGAFNNTVSSSLPMAHEKGQARWSMRYRDGNVVGWRCIGIMPGPGTMERPLLVSVPGGFEDRQPPSPMQLLAAGHYPIEGRTSQPSDKEKEPCPRK